MIKERFYILVAFLAVVGIGLAFYFGFLWGGNRIYGDAVISLTAPEEAGASGDVLPVDINLDSKGSKVAGASLFISYDPDVFSISGTEKSVKSNEASPFDWELKNECLGKNCKKGIVRYEVAALKNEVEEYKGSLGTLYLKVKEPAPEGNYEVKVLSEGELRSIVKNSALQNVLRSTEHAVCKVSSG